MINSVINSFSCYFNTLNRKTNIWISGSFAENLVHQSCGVQFNFTNDLQNSDFAVLIDSDNRYSIESICGIIDTCRDINKPLISIINDKAYEDVSNILCSDFSDKKINPVLTEEGMVFLVLGNGSDDFFDLALKTISNVSGNKIFYRNDYCPFCIGNSTFVYESMNLFVSDLVFNNLPVDGDNCIFIDNSGNGVENLFLDYFSEVFQIKIKSSYQKNIFSKERVFDKKKYPQCDFLNENRKYDVLISYDDEFSDLAELCLRIIKTYNLESKIISDRRLEGSDFCLLKDKDLTGVFQKTSFSIFLSKQDEEILRQSFYCGCPVLTLCPKDELSFEIPRDESSLRLVLHRFLGKSFDRREFRNKIENMSLSKNLSIIENDLIQLFDIFQDEEFKIKKYLEQKKETYDFYSSKTIDLFVLIEKEKDVENLFEISSSFREVSDRIFILAEKSISSDKRSLIISRFKNSKFLDFSKFSIRDLNNEISRTGDGLFVSVMNSGLFLRDKAIGEFIPFLKNEVKIDDDGVICRIIGKNDSKHSGLVFTRRGSIFLNNMFEFLPVSNCGENLRFSYYGGDFLWERNFTFKSDFEDKIDEINGSNTTKGITGIRFAENGKIFLEGDRSVEISAKNSMLGSSYFSLQDLIEFHIDRPIGNLSIFIDEFTEDTKRLLEWGIRKNTCTIDVFVRSSFTNVLDVFEICDKSETNSFNLIASSKDDLNLVSKIVFAIKSRHYLSMKIYPKIRIAIDQDSYNTEYLKRVLKSAVSSNSNIHSSGIVEVKEKYGSFLEKNGLKVI